MAPHSAKMSSAGKRKGGGDEKSVEAKTKKLKVSKTKQKVKGKSQVAVSTRQLRHRPDVVIAAEPQKEIPLPLSYTKHDLRVVMRFMCALGVAPAEIDRHLKTVFGQTISVRMVGRWCQQFRNGRDTVDNRKKSGRPRSVQLSHSSDEILNYIKTHRHAKLREICFRLSLPSTTTFNFIRDKLEYKMFLGCWVHLNLSEENKEERVKFSTVNLARCKSESLTTFINRIVVADQTWVYFHTTPLNKRPPPLKNEKGEVIKRKKNQSKKWTLETGPSPAIGLLMTVFWDSSGVVAIDFKDPETLSSSSNDSFRYSDKSSLKMLYHQVRAKRPGLLQTGLTLLMNEDLSSEEKRVVDEAGETITSRLSSFGWQGLFNPANSPDLSPSDYHLFLPLKKHVCGKRFADAEAGKRCVVEWLWAQDLDFFANGVQDLVTRWERCIKVKGEYLDK